MQRGLIIRVVVCGGERLYEEVSGLDCDRPFVLGCGLGDSGAQRVRAAAVIRLPARASRLQLADPAHPFRQLLSLPRAGREEPAGGTETRPARERVRAGDRARQAAGKRNDPADLL